MLQLINDVCPRRKKGNAIGSFAELGDDNGGLIVIAILRDQEQLSQERKR